MSVDVVANTSKHIGTSDLILTAVRVNIWITTMAQNLNHFHLINKIIYKARKDKISSLTEKTVLLLHFC